MQQAILERKNNPSIKMFPYVQEKSGIPEENKQDILNLQNENKEEINSQKPVKKKFRYSEPETNEQE